MKRVKEKGRSALFFYDMELMAAREKRELRFSLWLLTERPVIDTIKR